MTDHPGTGSDRDPHGLQQRIRDTVSRRLGVDVRALAAFRVAVGSLLIADLLMRGTHIRAFYTDMGTLPRSALTESYPLFSYVSLHALSGDLWFQLLLFFIAGAVAFCVTIGYRTRLATAVSFLLLISLHARNPLVLNGGDLTLRVFLFIGIFLPLGERWSVDAFRHKYTPRSRVVSIASATALLHVVLIYTTNAIFKLRGDMWAGGEAIEYSLSIDRYTVFLGDYLLNYPELLTAATWFWLGLLVSSFGLIVLTGWRRVALFLAFAGAHLGMALTLRLGLFPFVSVAVLVPFLPDCVWDVIEERTDGTVSVVRSKFGTRASETEQKAQSIRRILRVTGSIVVGAFLLVSVAWQGVVLGYVGMPEAVEGTFEPSDHRWSMFAPDPTADDGWYILDAELSDGEVIDGFGRDSVELNDPSDTAVTYPSALWHRYLSKIRHDEKKQQYLAEYLCHRTERNHEVSAIEISYHERPVHLGGTGKAKEYELAERGCV